MTKKKHHAPTEKEAVVTEKLPVTPYSNELRDGDLIASERAEESSKARSVDTDLKVDAQAAIREAERAIDSAEKRGFNAGVEEAAAYCEAHGRAGVAQFIRELKKP